MNLDERIGRFLREDVVPERDPLFRIRVLERGERQRYRRRSQAVLIGAVVLAALPAIALMLADNPIVAGLATLLCAATLAASLVAVSSLVQVARWLRAF